MTLYVCWETFPVPWPRRGVVPVLVLDDGEVIKDSKNIVTCARDDPAGDTG